LRIILVARREKKNAIFKLEREMAIRRESRAFSIAALLIGVLLAVTAFKYYVAPSVDPVVVTPTPSPTSFIFAEPPTREVPTATPTEPLPTPTRRVIRRSTPTPLPPPTSTPAPQVSCPNPQACIRYPAEGMQVSGIVQIRGTAAIPNFQFYKVEYGQGQDPGGWHSISDIHRQPVTDGVLETWNVSGFPAGVYTLRLTVVDITGNFPRPHEIQIRIG
jgi:hypothetical protein